MLRAAEGVNTIMRQKIPSPVQTLLKMFDLEKLAILE
jgi:hypothetical protein